MVRDNFCFSTLKPKDLPQKGIQKGIQKSMPYEVSAYKYCVYDVCLGTEVPPVTHRMFITLVHSSVIIAFTLNFQFHHLHSSEAY